MVKKTRKLVLGKETLRHLQGSELLPAVGGRWSFGSDCDGSSMCTPDTTDCNPTWLSDCSACAPTTFTNSRPQV